MRNQSCDSGRACFFVSLDPGLSSHLFTQQGSKYRSGDNSKRYSEEFPGQQRKARFSKRSKASLNSISCFSPSTYHLTGAKILLRPQTKVRVCSLSAESLDAVPSLEWPGSSVSSLYLPPFFTPCVSTLYFLPSFCSTRETYLALHHPLLGPVVLDGSIDLGGAGTGDSAGWRVGVARASGGRSWCSDSDCISRVYWRWILYLSRCCCRLRKGERDNCLIWDPEMWQTLSSGSSDWLTVISSQPISIIHLQVFFHQIE